MNVLGIAGRKGGIGKSTTAVNLGVAACESGRVVAIVDFDEKGSSVRWWARRRATHDAPPVLWCEPSQLGTVIKKLRNLRFDLVIIDTPGGPDPEARVIPALAACDLVLIPSGPNILDLEDVRPTGTLVARLGRPYACVLTKAPPVTSTRVSEGQEFLEKVAGLAGRPLHYLVDWPDAMARGLGVTEHKPKGTAAHEIRALWRWTAERLDRMGANNE